MPDLTDLECTVLGVVWKRAPCTAYAIMREFAGSHSTYYRGSAGAIYPVVSRLAERGVLEATKEFHGRRPRQTYRLTAKGTDALRSWLTPPLPDCAVTITLDPLRTRSFFLALLSPDQRVRFTLDAEARLREQLAINIEERDRYLAAGDPYSALATEGAIDSLHARIGWMVRARRRLGELAAEAQENGEPS